MDWTIENVLVPVTDVDRAKEFYVDRLGFALDVDHAPSEAFRVVQVTPPGSGCSLTFGVNVGAGEPGTLKGVHLCVPDIVAAHEHLERAGVPNDGIIHFGDAGQQPGPDPQRRTFHSYVHFRDPDGNSFAVQEVRRDTTS